MKEIDIYRAATEMLKQHGEDAVLQAALKSDSLLSQGDTTGAKIWRDIIKKIEILLQQKPEGKIH